MEIMSCKCHSDACVASVSGVSKERNSGGGYIISPFCLGDSVSAVLPGPRVVIPLEESGTSRIWSVAVTRAAQYPFWSYIGGFHCGQTAWQSTPMVIILRRSQLELIGEDAIKRGSWRQPGGTPQLNHSGIRGVPWEGGLYLKDCADLFGSRQCTPCLMGSQRRRLRVVRLWLLLLKRCRRVEKRLWNHYPSLAVRNSGDTHAHIYTLNCTHCKKG